MKNKKYQTMAFKTDGISCISCKNTIEKKLNSIDYIEKSNVDITNKTVYIMYDAKKTSTKKISNIINELDYNVTDIKKSNNEIFDKNNNKSFINGLIYGIVPHIGCIGFIIASILGATILMQFFRPLLMNKNIFYFLIIISIFFATLSSYLYLRKNNFLSVSGIFKKKKYLGTMYGLTIGINLMLFFLVFPLMANVSTATNDISNINPEDMKEFSISVNIPCPGHAPVVTNDLRPIDGIVDIRFAFPNIFKIKYDSSKIDEKTIIEQEIFQEFKINNLESLRLNI